ncbi:MAG: DUF4340 domain-containing protein [Verrucomicrobiota bacterium]
MKTKNLLALGLVAAAILLLGLVVRQANRSQWGSDSANVGAPLLPDLPINEIATISITGSDQSVTLARREGKWRVLERYGYPADWARISQAVKKLANETVTQAITVGPSQYDRLELLPPDGEPADKTGTRVRFLNAAGASLARLRLGKLHMSDGDAAQNPMTRGQSFPDGRYILLPDSADNADRKQVVLVSNPFESFVPDPTQWLNTQFLEIQDLSSARLERENETVWRLQSAPDSDKLTLAGDIPESMILKTSAVSETARALAYARINDIADPELPDSETGMDNPAIFHAVNDNHVACTIKIGAKTGNNYYVQANLAYREPDAANNDDSESESTSEKQTPDPDEIRAKTQKLNELLDGWTYLIPQQNVSKLIRPRNEFLKEKKNDNSDEESRQNPTPNTPAAPQTPPPPPTGE